MDIIAQIDRWAEVYPDKVAHQSGGQRLTYKELLHQSNQLADHLSRVLPDNNSPIVILGHKQVEMTVGFIASIKAGHPYIPLESYFPEQRIRAVVDTAQASLVLTAEKIREVLETTKENPDFKMRVRKPNDPWYIIFTSGSTGDPKGVVIPRSNLENFLNWTLPEHEIKEASTIILGQAPFTFDVSILDLYCSLYQAGTLVSVTNDEIANLKELFNMFRNSNATMWVSTPSFARLCLMDTAFNESMIPSLRRFWLAGEALAPEICTELLKRFPKTVLWNAYGPTEATVATTSVEITKEILQKYNPVPIGYPMPGTQILIHNKDGKPVPDGERGEIIICGPNVSPGYINRPDLTERAFFELNGQRAYHTGDWGRYKDGLIFYEGRIDFQIKLHGYRIELGDIEANLHALSNVQDAVVMPVMKEERADHLVAFVILKTKTTATDFELMQAMKKELSTRIPEYMIPRRFVFLNEFPMTSNGKADRRTLLGKSFVNTPNIMLMNKLEEFITGHANKTIAVAVDDLETDRQILVNENEAFHPASTFKVHVMMEVFRAVHEGVFSIEWPIPIINSFTSIADGSKYSLDVVDDSEKTLYQRLGENETIRELTRLMIVQSSNLATNILIEKVSAKNVNAFIQSLGIEGVVVRRGVEDNAAFRLGLNNSATANGLTQTMKLIADGHVISRKISQEMIDILLGQQFNESIPAFLPASAKVAHKTGWTGDVYHDTGIVFPEKRKPYAISIMTRGFPEDQEKEAHTCMATISKMIYEQIV